MTGLKADNIEYSSGSRDMCMLETRSADGHQGFPEPEVLS